MATTFDVVGPSASGQTATSPATMTWSHTCTGSNRALVVGVSVGQNSGSDATKTISGVTYGGVAMSSAGIIHNASSPNGYTHAWRLVNPPSGANNVVVTFASAPSTAIGGSKSYAGVDQTTPFGTAVTAAGDSALATCSVSTGSGSIVDFTVGGGSDFNATPTSPATVRYLNNFGHSSGGGCGAGATIPGTGGSVTCSWALSSDFWGIVAFEVKPAGSGASLTLGLVTETGTAFAIAKSKQGALGEVLETDSAFSLTRSKAKTLGEPVETDSAFAVAPTKNLPLGLTAEADSAFAVSRAKALGLGLASEVGSTFGLSATKLLALALALETDTASPLGFSKSVGLGLPASAESALPLSPSKAGALGLTGETDEPLGLGAAKSGVFGLPTESDSAFALVPAKSAGLGQVFEGDSVFALGRGKSLVLGLPVEIDTAFALNLTGGVALVLGLVTETETTFPLSATKVKSLGLITEADLPLVLGRAKSVILGQPSETESLFALQSLAKAVILGLTEEEDIALALDLDTGGIGPDPSVPTMKIWVNGALVEVELADMKVIRHGVPVEVVDVEVAGRG